MAWRICNPTGKTKTICLLIEKATHFSHLKMQPPFLSGACCSSSNKNFALPPTLLPPVV